MSSDEGGNSLQKVNMQKIHQNILIVLFSSFGIPTIFFIFELIWQHFKLGKYTGENIFIERSYCDPAEAEPTYLTLFMILSIGIITSYCLVKLIIRYRIIN